MRLLLHGPLALFIVQALLIISASRLIGLLARRMRQPMVIAEIAAGILLGPSLLGWAAPQTSGAVFPKDSLTLLSMLSQVGLIRFMFLVGLAFVVSIARAGSLGDAARTTVLALLYICVMVALVRPFLRRLAGRSANKEGLSQNLVAVTLVLLLLSSLATEAIGIHALFGAFLIGCIIPKANGFAQLLADKLEDLVVVFLLPLFFAFSGLRTQVGLLDSASAWWMCSLVIGVACLGKFGGSTVAARLTGLRWQEATAL